MSLQDYKFDLKKGKQVVLAGNPKPQKFDAKKDDSLYAWSNVRSEYGAAVTYRVAQTAYNAGSGRWRGFGYNGFSSPGCIGMMDSVPGHGFPARAHFTAPSVMAFIRLDW